MKPALRWLPMAVLGVAMGLWAGAASGQSANADGAYASQASPGRVSLSVRPTWRDGRLVVDVSANTHSVDLSGIDVAHAVRLRVAGDELAQSSASKLAGHHARGTVTFVLPDRPERFDIVIRGVPDQPERVLRWPVRDTGSSR